MKRNKAAEEMMRNFYNSLDEKNRRRFAGFEALRHGHGGQSYIAGVGMQSKHSE